MASYKWRWYAEGYQEGMADIARELEVGGVEAVQEWLKNNYTRAMDGAL